MVYDKGKQTAAKKPRIKIEGKLIGMQGDSTIAKVFDAVAGKFSFLQLSIVVGMNPDGSSIYKNVTAYDVKMSEMPELKKADEMIRNKIRPQVSLECYESDQPAIDKVTKQPIMEEVVEVRNGKEVIVQKQ